MMRAYVNGKGWDQGRTQSAASRLNEAGQIMLQHRWWPA